MAAYTSSGLVALGRRLGLPLAIIDAVQDPTTHLERLARDEHACWCLEEDWIFDGVGGTEVDPLSPAFRQVEFDPRWLAGWRPMDGVAIDAGSILVTLPRTVDAGSFGRHLRAVLAPRRLDRVAARPGQVHRRRATGRPVRVASRYSRPGGNGLGSTSFRRVDDLYEFRPNQFVGLVSSVLAARDRVDASRTVIRLIDGDHRT